MKVQTFTIEGKYYGFCERNPVIRHAETRWPCSYAFFCPVCGRVWAEATVEGSNGPERFSAITRSCRLHGNPVGVTVPGSLFLDWDEAFDTAIPEEVLLQWELPRHLDYAERKFSP